MTYLLGILLLWTVLWAIRQWDRARHAERTMLEMAANARAERDRLQGRAEEGTCDT
jgi:hypothetical protein